MTCRKPTLIDALRMCVGACLIILAGFFIYEAIELNVGHTRGTSYRCEESPIPLFLLFFVCVLAVICGVAMVISGAKGRHD